MQSNGSRSKHLVQNMLLLVVLGTMCALFSMNQTSDLAPRAPASPVGGDSALPTEAGSFPQITVPNDIQPDVVQEFNGTESTGFSPIRDCMGGYSNTSVIWQWGHSEAVAFYSVSGNTVKNYTDRHTSGFDVKINPQYYPYWNLSHVNYFNISSIINYDMDEFYLTDNEVEEDLTDIVVDFDEPDSFDIQPVETKYSNISGMKLHFNALNLKAGDKLKIYNDSLDMENPLIEVAGPTTSPSAVGTNGWTVELENTKSAWVVVNSSSDTSAANPVSYTLDRINVTGSTFNHTGTDQMLIEVNPDIIGFNVSLSNLQLADSSRFIISDPFGYNVTEIWRYDSLGGDPRNNWSIYFDSNGDAKTSDGQFGASQWINPDYTVLKMYSDTPGNCEFTIARIRYNTTKGWQRYYYHPETPDEYQGLITYTPFGGMLRIYFWDLFGGNPTDPSDGGVAPDGDPAVSKAYSSWTFVFHKDPIQIDLDIYKLQAGVEPELVAGDPEDFDDNAIILESDTSYTFSFKFTDALYQFDVDWFNFVGEDNPVRLDIWQGRTLLHTNTTTAISNGVHNFTVADDWGTAEGVHHGDIQVLVAINNTNYAALDNTTCREQYRLAYYEHPTLLFNRMSSEKIGTVYSPAATTSAGTLYDPNTITFNVTARDIYGENEPLNGQPINVTVKKGSTVRHTETIFQNHHPADGDNYALFTFSFQEIGDWDVIFNLVNSSTGIMIGYFLSPIPVTVDITVTARPFTIALFNGTLGLRPGEISELYANITDLEEVDVEGYHYPLPGWRVDYYYLKKVAQQYQKFYINTATTNNSGIAKILWTPPRKLAGEEIYILGEAFTPTDHTPDKLLQYEPSSYLMQYGFEIERLNTTVSVTPAKPQFYNDEALEFDVHLEDGFNGQLVNYNVSVNVTVGHGTKYQYTFLMGQNSSDFVVDFSPYIGEVQIDAAFEGNAAYMPDTFTTNLTFDRCPTELAIIVNPIGYNFIDDETIPMNISIADARYGDNFYDSGIVNVTVTNATGEQLDTWEVVLTAANLSFFPFEEWNVTENGMYNVSVVYEGGLKHLPSNSSVEVYVERAPVTVEMTEVFPVAGQALVIPAHVKFTNNNTPAANLEVAFEFTDLMGNIYLLGTNYTNATGHVWFKKPYQAGNYLYEYMVEFGGVLTVTSRMDLRYTSGFDRQAGFQIQKCPSNIEVGLASAGSGSVLLTFNLNTSGYISPVGQPLEIEIWSDSGFDYRKYTRTVQAEQIGIRYQLPETGSYYVRVVYKGSRTISADATMLTLNRTSALGPQAAGIGSQMRGQLQSGDPLFLFYLQFLLLMIPLLIYAKLKWRVQDRKMKMVLGGLLICIFAVSGIYMISYTNASVPYSENRLSALDLNSSTGFEWLANQDLPEEDLAQYSQMLNLDGYMQNQSTGGALGDINALLGLMNNGGMSGMMGGSFMENLVDPSPVQAAPRAASAQNVSLGSFGSIPYPIGDVLNVTFTTTETSNYFVVITDVNLNQRVKSMFGTSVANQEINVEIPIDHSFNVGGKYALELTVYRRGVTEYLARDLRRMTFSVVRGFSNLEVQMDDIELFQDRQYIVTLTEEYSGQPLQNREIQVLTYSEAAEDYERLTTQYTDARGRIRLPYPQNTEQGMNPMKFVFAGDSLHYACENMSSYDVNPITTFLSLSASPARYTDEAVMSALLYDQTGQRLANKSVKFFVHLYNTTLGDKKLIRILNNWMVLGNATTDANGLATITYRALFPEGLYDVSAIFEGDDIYNETGDGGYILQVSKENLEIDFMNTTLTYGSSGLLTANITDDEGNPSTYTAVNYSAYVNHEWVDLGGCITTGDGTAALQYTPYFEAGDYPLRIIKQADNRYKSNMNYGTLTVKHTNAYLDIGLNTTEYLSEITLSARLTFDNGTLVQDLPNESLLFYVEQDMPDGSLQYTYVGYGVTDVNGTARCVWNATDRKPGMYTLKVFFPGNDLVNPVEAYEYGLEITHGTCKIQASAPAVVPVIDYADFTFNLTNVYGEYVWGETLRIKITNASDPTQVDIERDIVTDVNGYAYFRWCPSHPGNFTFEARLISDYYYAPPFSNIITVARKAVMINASLSLTKYYRGDVCDIAGNTSITYKYYNGSTTVLPATSVPLRFYIWNESLFTHPVSGFMVPNMPLRDLDGDVNTYSGDGPIKGLFWWSFRMPDEFFGLQAGRYYVKIRVDTTKTGLYKGEAYFSFDLVEHTTLSVNVEYLENVQKAHAGTHPWSRTQLESNLKYFVEEHEIVHIYLKRQSIAGVNHGLHRFNYEQPTVRDLKVQMGTDTTLYFYVDVNNNPRIYEGQDPSCMTPANDLTAVLHPQYDNETGHYWFDYWPYYPGSADVSVVFPGDRFYDPNAAVFQRTVWRRPTYFDTWVSHVKELYRKDSTAEWLQRGTNILTESTDVLNGTPVPDHTIEYYLGGTHMVPANGFQFGDSVTDSVGRTNTTWAVDNHVQAGDYDFTILFKQTRVWHAYASDKTNREFGYADTLNTEPYTLEIWELTKPIVSIIQVDDQWKITVQFKDQDQVLISDAIFAVSVTGYVRDEYYVGGDCRTASSAMTSGTTGEVMWDPSDDNLKGGLYTVIVDFLGDETRNLRSSSIIDSSTIRVRSGGGVEDILYHDDTFGDVSDHPYVVKGDEDNDGTDEYYFNIQEARRKLSASDGGVLVNTFDCKGFVDARDAFYIWQKNNDQLWYFPYFHEQLPVIIAFAERETALAYADAAADYQARLVSWDMVWPKSTFPYPQIHSASAGAGPRLPHVEVTKPSNREQMERFFMANDSALASIIPDANNPNAAGPPNAAQQEAALFFNTLADTGAAHGVRGLYVFIFRLIAYACLAGYEKDPDRLIKKISQSTEENTNLTMTFESFTGAIDAYGSLTGQTTSFPQKVKEGDYALALSSTGTGASAGDNVTLGLGGVTKERARVKTITFWVRYKANKESGTNDWDDHLNGINVTFIDALGHKVAQPLRFTAANFDSVYGTTSRYTTYGDWIQYNLSVNDFQGHPEFSWSTCSEMAFVVREGGFLDSASEELYVDHFQFYYQKLRTEEVTLAGRWKPPTPESVGMWILKTFVLEFFVRPIYEALIFGIGQLINFPNLSTLLSWGMIITIFESIVGGAKGTKSPFEAIMDVIMGILAKVYSILRGRKHLGDTEDVELADDDPDWLLKVGDANDEVTASGFKRFMVFVATASLQGIMNNIPMYWYSKDDTWDDCYEHGRTDIWSMAKQGLKAFSFKYEIMMFISVLITGSLVYLAKKIDCSIFTHVVDNLVTMTYDVFNEILSRKAKKSNPHASRVGTSAKFSEKELVGVALENFIVLMLVDIIFDIILMFLEPYIPSFLMFILDKLVRLAVKLVVLAFLYPGEISMSPGKIALMLVVMLLTTFVITPIVTKVVGENFPNLTYIFDDGFDVAVTWGDGDQVNHRSTFGQEDDSKEDFDPNA